VSETVPYTDTGSVGDYRSPTGSEAGTHYTYDALGRTKVVTNPDGTNTKTWYRGWQEAVIVARDPGTNAYGSLKVYEKDAFGRLVQVHEYDGEYNSPVWDGNQAYAHTSYFYDERDNLLRLYDANAHGEDGEPLADPPYATLME